MLTHRTASTVFLDKRDDVLLGPGSPTLVINLPRYRVRFLIDFLPAFFVVYWDGHSHACDDCTGLSPL